MSAHDADADADDLRTLLRRQQETRDALDRLPPPPSEGTVSILGQTGTITSYPTVAAAYYAIQPCLPGGPEQEGETPQITQSGGMLVAMNLGTAVPPAATYVIVTMIGGRYVFRYDG